MGTNASLFLLKETRFFPFFQSFEKDGVNLLFKVQDLRQVVNTKKNLNNVRAIVFWSIFSFLLHKK
jgi:hypothetical protein